MKYTVVMAWDPEYSGYSVEVPFLPGCFSQGRTVEEAMRNIREAIECYLEASDPVAVNHDSLISATVEV